MTTGDGCSTIIMHSALLTSGGISLNCKTVVRLASLISTGGQGISESTSSLSRH